MGKLGTAAKLAGVGFLFNTFFAGTGKGGLTMDNLSKWAEDFGIDASFLEDGLISDAIDGREGPLSLLIGALTVFPKGMKTWGILGALGWMGASLFKDMKSGELDQAVKTVFGDPNSEKASTLKLSAEAQKYLDGVDLPELGATTLPPDPKLSDASYKSLENIARDPTGTPANLIQGGGQNAVNAVLEGVTDKKALLQKAALDIVRIETGQSPDQAVQAQNGNFHLESGEFFDADEDPEFNPELHLEAE